jgi:signal recognition particle receptor subunit beta
VQINFPRREIHFKLVYYGPGLSGKTTNLEVLHKKAPAAAKGELTQIATEGDRTLYFDYMPLELAKVGGLTTKFQIYTVPGQKFYDSTRKLVLQGADGVVFVADSQPEKMPENEDSLANLEAHLREQGLDLDTLPVVFQWNKRDLPDVVPVEEMAQRLNRIGAPAFEAIAVTGEGVFATLKKLAQIVLVKAGRDLKNPAPVAPRPATPAPVAPPPRPAAIRRREGDIPVPPPAPATPRSEGDIPLAPLITPEAAPILAPSRVPAFVLGLLTALALAAIADLCGIRTAFLAWVSR